MARKGQKIFNRAMKSHTRLLAAVCHSTKLSDDRVTGAAGFGGLFLGDAHQGASRKLAAAQLFNLVRSKLRNAVAPLINGVASYFQLLSETTNAAKMVKHFVKDIIHD